MIRSRIRHYANAILKTAFFSTLRNIAYVVWEDLNSTFFFYCNRIRKSIRLQYSKVVRPFVRFFMLASNNGRMVQNFNKYEAFKLKMSNEHNKNVGFIHHSVLLSGFRVLSNLVFCYVFFYRNVVLCFIVEMKLYEKK